MTWNGHWGGYLRLSERRSSGVRSSWILRGKKSVTDVSEQPIKVCLNFEDGGR